jgi:3-methyladenine DNA glycosylase AlkC
MEPLKNLYSVSFYEQFCSVIKTIVPDFNSDKFLKSIFDNDWNGRELKSRMKHTTVILHDFLPKDFAETSNVLVRLTTKLQAEGLGYQALQYMFVPDYIEKYGIGHFEESVKAFEKVTQFTSCEFAVRPFIVKYPEQMMAKMLDWSMHENHHLRRLSSEGCRPRLPWAMALPAFKKNPNPILSVLENLKQDTSEYVRRSVANNLNDIIKDNPDIVLGIMKKWAGLGKETDYILKHGCRTLLKSGHAETLGHFGLVANENLKLSNFKIQNRNVLIGENLDFSFQLENKSTQTEKVRLEYVIYFLRANGTWAKKVFKISEREFLPNERAFITRHQSFRPITTRVYYVGIQRISIVINGVEKEVLNFELGKK